MLGPLLAALLALGSQQRSPAAGVPMQLVNNHVVVSVTLNGAGPFRFIVDSGAGNVIDPAVASAIGARVGGSVRLVGVGRAVQRGRTAVVHRVTIGATSFADQRFVVAASRSTFGAAEGPTVDGLIGRDIIGAGVTVFDYANRRLTFHAGRDAVSGRGTLLLPVADVAGEPAVACKLDDIDATCAIDTGSRLNVTVLGRFAEQHPGLMPATRSAIGIDGYGIGGAAYGRLGRLKKLSFGSLSLHRVVADFSVQQRGAFASRRLAANVGGGVLRHFTLAFDMPHHRIALRPNADINTPDAVDRSGLFLVIRGPAVTVLGVRAQTPAAHAGIVPGDRIVRAQGRPVRPAALPQLRALLDGPPDSRVRLTIARAGRMPRTLELKLRDYL
jgi:hypothetical protein